jgi:hypothetical protein
MELAHLTVLTSEPASVFYIVTGAVGLLFTRLRNSGRSADSSSVAMLFCRKSTRDKLRQVSLT